MSNDKRVGFVAVFVAILAARPMGIAALRILGVPQTGFALFVAFFATGCLISLVIILASRLLTRKQPADQIEKN